MEILEVGDVTTPKVITEDEETSVTKLSRDMEVAGIGSVVITKEGQRGCTLRDVGMVCRSFIIFRLFLE